jgi:1-acyl-sn-glycerol-3-phosphate acyltransferase
VGLQVLREDAYAPDPADLWVRLGAVAERLARTLGTWLLFAIFGVGALVLAGVLPVLARTGRRGERFLLAQRLIQRSFRVFLRLGTALRLFEVTESGTQGLRAGGLLVAANHPTLLDVVILISRMPQADCVVKREAWRNPFLRGIVAAADYIPNGHGGAVVEACAKRLRAGRSVLLFPEGSRSPRGGLGRFQRGAARIALRSGRPITPVVVRCDPPALAKGEPGYLPSRKLRFSIEVGEPLVARVRAAADDAPAVAARRITAELHSYFRARLDRG